jgi:TPR repeat protein
MGDMYRSGFFGVPQDFGEAVKWYRKAADQGNAGAQVKMGEVYLVGRGVPRDYGEALKWYRKAADQGNARAQEKMGDMYSAGHGVPRDLGDAMKWYRKAADRGSVDAQVKIGDMYAVGLGVPRDFGEAVQWYRKAADQGNARAQTTLGAYYRRGLGVPQDRDLAIKWYRMAADQGWVGADAACDLGELYSEGSEGIPPDPSEAMKWYREAAQHGNLRARNALQVVLDQQEDSLAARDSGILSEPLSGARRFVRAVKRLLVDPRFMIDFALVGALTSPALLWVAIRRMKGAWRWFAYPPLLIMVLLLVYTAMMAYKGANLIFVPPLFVLPPVFVYLVALLVAHTAWNWFRSAHPTARSDAEADRTTTDEGS